MASDRPSPTPSEPVRINVMALRRGPGFILDQVEAGTVFHITKRGKVVAVLSKPKE